MKTANTTPNPAIVTNPPLCARRFGDAPEEDLTVPADVVLVAFPLDAPAAVPDAVAEALLALVFMVDDAVELEPDLTVVDVPALALADDEASAFAVADDEASAFPVADDAPAFPVAVEVETLPVTTAAVDMSSFVDC